ncbi:hypothetical protein HY837_04150 [archaeon]|nr:hypothetical protein [archaeon]
MEKAKKRHNPPILEEKDLAVKAFDAQPRSDFNDSKLDEIITQVQQENKNSNVVKGEEALKQEFKYLLKRFFGEELFFKPTKFMMRVFYPLGTSKAVDAALSPNICDLYIQEGRFLNTHYERQVLIECTLPKQEKKSTDRIEFVIPSIFENNQYNPIQITAFTPKALKQAKLFAQVYEKLSGHPVKIIQECKVEEELEELIPKIQVRNIEDLMKGKEKYQLSNGKEFTVGLTESAWSKEYLKLMNDVLSPEFYAKDAFAQGYFFHYTNIFKSKRFSRKKVAKINRTTLGRSFPSDVVIEVYSEEVLPKCVEFAELYKKLTDMNASVRKNF